ncbi:MAG: tRNA-dihydrouridine synthase family protein, partial [bacterium]
MTNPSFWQEKITIGKLNIPRFMTAPMDGITDSPLRQVIREFSPEELLWGEMRHVASISAPINIHTEKALYFDPIEQPIGFQFSANMLEHIEKAVERVIEHKFIMINLNCGCPARRVVGSGSGSALMANIPLLRQILALFMKAINNQVPMTIKIRAGY